MMQTGSLYVTIRCRIPYHRFVRSVLLLAARLRLIAPDRALSLYEAYVWRVARFRVDKGPWQRVAEVVRSC